MARRIDALGADRARLSAITGELLSRELDDQLQACVEEAADKLGTPIALITLVLERTQFFRAFHGLPIDLAVARATDRDASFCQFVVRDAMPFEVRDAHSDDRVPTELVDRYGISSYLGVPVVVAGQVVGSLCVVDQIARSFNDDEKRVLVDLAAAASERLEVLASARPDARGRLLSGGLEPAFGQIRNDLLPIMGAADGLRMIATELRPLAELVASDLDDQMLARALGGLRGTSAAFTTLDEIGEELEHSAQRLFKTISAVQQVVIAGSPKTRLSEIVDTGLTLARHLTKLIGSVDVAEVPAVSVWCSLSLGGSVVSMAASMLAAHSTGPLELSGRVDGSVAALSITSPTLTDEALGEVLGELNALTDDLGIIGAGRLEFGVVLRFRLA